MCLMNSQEIRQDKLGNTTPAVVEGLTWTERDELILDRAVDQIHLLDDQLKQLEHRKSTALNKNRKLYAYQLDMRIMTLASVRAMFYEFCEKRANKLMMLQEEAPKEEIVEEVMTSDD